MYMTNTHHLFPQEREDLPGVAVISFHDLGEQDRVVGKICSRVGIWARRRQARPGSEETV